MQARQYTSTLSVGRVFGVQAIRCHGGFTPKEDSPYFSNTDLNDLGTGFADGQVPKGERTVSKVKHLEEHDPFVTRDLKGQEGNIASRMGSARPTVSLRIPGSFTRATL